MSSSLSATLEEVPVLLGGKPRVLRKWTEEWNARQAVICVGVIILGAGLYGAAMGSWRAPLQALYVAVKFPVIILLTTLGNAVLNALLAPLLGLSIRLRESLMAVLLSFTVVACILGSFSPVVAFLVWNAPPLSAEMGRAGGTYDFMLLTHVAVIAFAGIIGNLRLAQLLRELSGNAAVAGRVLLAWLACNLFLGSQLSWLCRPFIGSPALPVQFLRENAFRGNFYEIVFGAALALVRGH